MNQKPEPSSVTVEIARSCPIDQIRQLVFSKNHRILAALLDNPNLTEQEICLLVRQRGIPADIIGRIMADRRWNTTYTVILDVVKNPSTPRHIALRYLKFLYRQDLAGVARNVFLSGPVRQLAIHFLETRIEELELGEKIALARSASPPILRILLAENDPQIMAACLLNSQLPELELVGFISRHKVTEKVLAEIAHNPNWRCRYKVRKALAQHPNTPGWMLDEILADILLQDLLSIINSAFFRLEVKLAARRSLIKKMAGLEMVERVQIAKYAPRRLIDILIRDSSSKVIKALLRNRRMTEGHVAYLALATRSPQILSIIQQNEKWRHRERVQLAISQNPLWRNDLNPDAAV